VYRYFFVIFGIFCLQTLSLTIQISKCTTGYE
jgi:hypothetical protein